MDDFELALQNMEASRKCGGADRGVELIQSKFVATLKSQGVQASGGNWGYL